MVQSPIVQSFGHRTTSSTAAGATANHRPRPKAHSVLRYADTGEEAKGMVSGVADELVAEFSEGTPSKRP